MGRIITGQADIMDCVRARLRRGSSGAARTGTGGHGRWGGDLDAGCFGVPLALPGAAWRWNTACVSVWEKLAECVSQLDEPFGRSEILGWFRRHYPDVKESTLAAHIQAATANAPNRDRNFPYHARRAPLLRRTGHGQYVRALGGSAGAGMTVGMASGGGG